MTYYKNILNTIRKNMFLMVFKLLICDYFMNLEII